MVEDYVRSIGGENMPLTIIKGNSGIGVNVELRIA